MIDYPMDVQTQSQEQPTHTDVVSEITELKRQLALITIRLTALASLSKRLGRDHDKVVKASTKGKRRQQNSDAPPRPNAFTSPYHISDDMCRFLGLESGSTAARTDVTKAVSAYVREHKLQREGNGRVFDLTKSGGDVLAELFGQEDRSAEAGYMNLQKLVKHHFAGRADVVPEPSAEVEAPVPVPVQEAAPTPSAPVVTKKKVVRRVVKSSA